MDAKEGAYKIVREFLRQNALKGLAGIVLGVSALGFGGCAKEFFETDFIEQNMQNVFDRQESIEDTYKREGEIQVIRNTKRKEESRITVNADGTYVLFYKCQFADAAKLKTLLAEQVPSCKPSISDSLNQITIPFPDETQISYVRNLLFNNDKMPSQVLLKLSIYNDYGDHTRDFETHINLLNKNNPITSTNSADYTGASTRVRGREDIGTKYGVGYSDRNIQLKAILDVLESKGYVKQLYQTEMLLTNKEKGRLEEEEKIPIPNTQVVGQSLVNTFVLEPIKSFFEGTPTIYENGLVKLTFTAGIGSAKRPEGPIQVTVPVKDMVDISGVYLKVGQPLILAGKANEFEVGVHRGDPIFPIFKGKDWEKRVSRIYYVITPTKIVYVEDDENGTVKEYETEKIKDPNTYDLKQKVDIPKKPKFNILFE